MGGKQSFPKGEYIFREGESAAHAYILHSGVVEIVKAGVDGEVVLATLESENDLFGELAVIDGTPRSASVRAKEDATVTEVDEEAFKTHLRSNPSAAMTVMRKLATELRVANQRFTSDGEADQESEIDAGRATWQSDARLEVDDTDAIYDSPASRPIIYLGGVLVLLLTAAVIFSLRAMVDTTVSARGKLTTSSPNVDVQAGSSAVVRKVLIARGDNVAEGQLLALLDRTAAEANAKSNAEQMRSVSSRIRRLELEQMLIRSGHEPPLQHGLGALDLDILSKRLQQYRSKMNAFASRIRKIDRQIRMAKTEVKSAKATVRITGDQLKLKRRIENLQHKLYKEHHTSLLNYLTAKDATLAINRSYYDAVNEADVKLASLTAVRSDKDTLSADQTEFVAKWSSSLSEALSDEKQRLTALTHESLKLRQALDSVEIRAPLAGVVLDQPSISPGSIVAEGEKLMTLVATDQPLTLEVDIDPKDISDLRVDASVSVKLDALPFQQYGDIPGNVEFISRDTFGESLSGEKGAYYRARVRILQQDQTNLPGGFRLTPGMLATADVKVGEKRLFTYLANPIIKGFGSAFTEPD